MTTTVRSIASVDEAMYLGWFQLAGGQLQHSYLAHTASAVRWNCTPIVSMHCH